MPGPQRQAEELGSSFEAPLRESVRAVKAAQAVMADRGAALATVQQARAEVDAKRAKLTKLRGVAGIKVTGLTFAWPGSSRPCAPCRMWCLSRAGTVAVVVWGVRRGAGWG